MPVSGLARRTASNAAGRLTAVRMPAVVNPTTAGRWRSTAAGDHLEAYEVLLALRSREQDALRGALAGDAEGLALERQHP
jgi:hypothetical protein